MNIAIVGSRDLPQAYQYIKDYIDSYVDPDDTIVSGGARGVDTIAIAIANSKGLKTLVFPAEWDKYGKSAGFRRNITIVENADRVVAFYNGVSKGTQHTIDIAHRLGIPVEVIHIG